MPVYYVDDVSGSDSNSGLSESAAYQTLAKVQALLTAGTVGQGDSVLFRRGGIFYGNLVPPTSYTTTGRYLTIAPYGNQGKWATLSAYKILNTSGGWVNDTGGVWKVDLTNSATHTGWNSLAVSNVGFLKVDGVIKGKRVWAKVDLTNPWDFYCDATTIYVKASANPTTLAIDIRASSDANNPGGGTAHIRMNTRVKVTGMELVGFAGNVLSGPYNKCRAYGNKASEFGGALLSGTTRYGNAVQYSIGSVDSIVQGNVWEDGYDVGMSPQGTQSGSNLGWTDLIYRDNRTVRCAQAYEFWGAGSIDTSKGFLRCLVENNESYGDGRGWSASVRPNPLSCCTLLFYQWQLASDITFRNNLAYDPVCYNRHDNASPITGVVRKNNTVVLREDALAHYLASGSPDVATPATSAISFFATAGVEQGTQFLLLPASDPINYDDAIQQISGMSSIVPVRTRALQAFISQVRADQERMREDVDSAILAAAANAAGSPNPQPSLHGLLGWSMDVMAAPSASTPGAGAVALMAIPVPVTQTFSKVWAYASQAGTGVTALANCYMALYDSAGNRLGVSADQSSAWATTGVKSATLTADATGSLTVVGGAGVFVYAAILVGTQATVPVQFMRGAGGVSALGDIGPRTAAQGQRFASTGTGQSAMPATYSLAAATPGTPYFAGLS